MSTKQSLFLTKDNEHWYKDYTDKSITIEINHENIQNEFYDSENIIIEIKEGCQLNEFLQQIRIEENK